MRILTIAALAMLLCVSPAVAGDTTTSWHFNTDGDYEGWTLVNMDGSSVSGGLLRLNPAASDPRIVSPLLTHVPVRTDYLRIGMWNRGSNEVGTVYYSGGGLGYSETRKATFAAPRSSTEEYYWLTIWTGGVSGWEGLPNIDYLRVDPVQEGIPVSGSDEIRIDYVFRRVDNTNPSPPEVLSVTPSGWTNGNFTVSWRGNDPSDRPANPVGPDAYGSGVRRFYYRVETQADTWIVPDDFDDHSGWATAARTVSAVKQGVNVFHVYSNDNADRFGTESTAQLKFDSVAPTNPTLSSSHSCGVWSSDNTIAMSWSGASDATSGIAGYSWEWSQSATTSPDCTVDGTGTNTTSPARPEGSNYFHLRTIDNAGNCSAAIHSCQFLIDTTVPTNPTQYTSTPTADTWSNDNTVQVCWSGASDARSGIQGYSLVWSGSSATVPDGTVETSATCVTSVPLANGTYYLHVRAIDNANLAASGALHCGPFRIDTTPPSSTTSTSPSHAVGVCAADNTIEVSWPAATDSPSGIGGYSWVWDTFPGTDPPCTIYDAGVSTTSPILPDGSLHYFHIRAVDLAGNCGTSTHLGPFCLDTGVQAVQSLESPTHPLGACRGQDNIEVTWTAPGDLSGLAGYSWVWDRFSATDPDTDVDGTATAVWSGPVADGEWHFHVRAIDGAGNAGPVSHLGPMVVDTSPPWVVLTNPLGYDAVYAPGQTVSITFTHDATGIETCEIWYLKTPTVWVDGQPVDGGIESTLVAVPELTLGDSVSVYNWTTPPDTTRQGQVMIRAWDCAANAASDISGSYFQISPWAPLATPEHRHFGNALLPGSPNPFRQQTVITFTLEKGPSVVTLRIADVRGRLVRDLLNGERGPGLWSVVWDGRDDAGNDVSPGIYFYSLQTPGFRGGGRVLRLK